MNRTATLPLFPFPVVGRPEPDVEALRERSGVAHYPLPVREILNRQANPRMPFVWSINPYRGCEIGCTYCYARYTHGFFDLDQWEDFERKIFVKSEAGEALSRRLRRSSLAGQPIAIGTATDPYQPAEKHHGVTRSLLEAFLAAEGLEISLTTKSPLVLRDLDLLAELDRRHSVTVNVTVTTLDARLARRLETHAPDPATRLRTVERLAEEGIATQVCVKPLLPGINDDPTALDELLGASRRAGASDVQASPLFLRPAARARFWPWLKNEFPALAGLYSRLYGKRDTLDAHATDQLLADFRRLRLQHGFPHPRPGRV